MATVTKSIGATGRDYATVTAWIAASYGATSSDDAIGEMYNDGVFSEAFSINDHTPLSVLLRANADHQHDGTPGSGVRIACPSRVTLDSDTGEPLKDLFGVEIYCTSNTVTNLLRFDAGYSTQVCNAASCLIHSLNYTTASAYVNVYAVSYINNAGARFVNCQVFDIKHNTVQSGKSVNGVRLLFTSGSHVYNCTVHNIQATNASGSCDAIGIYPNYVHAINNVVTDCVTAGSGTGYCYGNAAFLSESYNLSSDTTAAGTGSLTSKASADQYVSNVEDSEDLHLKDGSDAIGAGTPLGTVYGVNIDIDGWNRNRNAVWDMGSHQKVHAGAGAGIIMTGMGGGLD